MELRLRIASKLGGKCSQGCLPPVIIMAELKIIRNKDHTITVRVGGYSETISTQDKSQMQIIDEVRWAAITAGVHVSEERIYEVLHGN